MPWRFVSRKASNCGIGPQVPKILRSINRSALARLNDVRSMSDGMTGWIKTRIGRGAESRWTLAAALALTMQFAPHAGLARPAGIAPSVDASDDSDDDALPYVQCVPFARQASGIQLYGDALNWWDQADGHYARGHVPQAGAVMSFRPYHAMSLGHVAMVSKVIDSRTVLLRHANWSPIGGRRGQPELDVRAVDVSPTNDWSEVRVWYAPIGDLGTTHWPVNGFIYKHAPRKGEPPLLSNSATLAQNAPIQNAPIQADTPRMTRLSAVRSEPSRIDGDFLDGIRPETSAATPRAPRQNATAAPRPTRNYLFARASTVSAGPTATAPTLRDDPIGRIIAARMKHQSD